MAGVRRSHVVAPGTVVFTAVLLIRNISAYVRLRHKNFGDKAGATRTRNQALSGVVTQLLVWITGIFAVYLLGWVGFVGAFKVGNTDLIQLPTGQKVIIGLMAASTLSVVNELKKALDKNDSARTPPLLGKPIVPPKPGAA